MDLDDLVARAEARVAVLRLLTPLQPDGALDVLTSCAEDLRRAMGGAPLPPFGPGGGLDPAPRPRGPRTPRAPSPRLPALLPPASPEKPRRAPPSRSPASPAGGLKPSKTNPTASNGRQARALDYLKAHGPTARRAYFEAMGATTPVERQRELAMLARLEKLGSIVIERTGTRGEGTIRLAKSRSAA